MHGDARRRRELLKKGQIPIAAGVASKAEGHSIKTVNDQENYSLWEFYYDPSKDAARAAAGALAQMGGGQQRGIGQSSTSSSSGFNSGSSSSSGFGGFGGGPSGMQNSSNNGFGQQGGTNNSFGGFGNSGTGNSSGGFGNSSQPAPGNRPVSPPQ